jgi:hypothetical protein
MPKVLNALAELICHLRSLRPQPQSFQQFRSHCSAIQPRYQLRAITRSFRSGLKHTPVDAETGRVRSFAITYRNGSTDVAWTIGGNREDNQGRNMKLVFRPSFEEGLIAAACSTQSRLRQFGLTGPWVVQASVYGVRDHFIVLNDGNRTKTAFKDTAFLGQLRLDNIEAPALLPLAEKLCLLFGMHRPANPPFGQ